MMNHQRIRRIRMMLSITGFVAFTAGWLTLAFASVRMHTFVTPELTLNAAVYVSTESCLTCHADTTGAWSDAVHPLPIQNAVLNPHAVMSAATQAITIEEPSSLSRELSTNSGWNRDSQPPTGERRQYVVQTESGTWVQAIPWDLRLSPVIRNYVPLDVLNSNCAPCHSGLYTPSPVESTVRLSTEYVLAETRRYNVFMDDFGKWFDWSAQAFRSSF